MTSPIKTREGGDAADAIPELLPYIALVPDTDISKERGADVYARDRNIFVPGTSDPHAFLLHLKRVVETKVRSKNITSASEFIDVCASFLSPMDCSTFLQT